jgi:hypothetical protein
MTPSEPLAAFVGIVGDHELEHGRADLAVALAEFTAAAERMPEAPLDDLARYVEPVDVGLRGDGWLRLTAEGRALYGALTLRHA